MILEVVKEHNQLNDSKKDLLLLIFSEAEKSRDANDAPKDVSINKFIVDNCKYIYFTGHKTIAISASWCLMTLASYPDRQARARAEVLEICGKNAPDADMLRNMKMLTMVIQETLRLYPPVAFVVRETLEDIKFKEIHVPKGINVQIPIPILHQHQDLWESDLLCSSQIDLPRGSPEPARFHKLMCHSESRTYSRGSELRNDGIEGHFVSRSCLV